MIWSPLSSSGGTMTRMPSSGALDGIFDVRVARSASDLVDENDGVLLLALHANGHQFVIEGLVPHVVDRLLTTPPSSSGSLSSGLVEGCDGVVAGLAGGGGGDARDNLVARVARGQCTSWGY